MQRIMLPKFSFKPAELSLKLNQTQILGLGSDTWRYPLVHQLLSDYGNQRLNERVKREFLKTCVKHWEVNLTSSSLITITSSYLYKMFKMSHVPSH